MKTIIWKQIDLLTEAVLLLIHVAADSSPIEVKKKILARYEVSPELLEEPFRVSHQLVREGKRKLKPQMELVKEYFSPLGEDGILCMASFALLLDLSDYQETLESRREFCFSRTEGQRSQLFYLLICSGFGLEESGMISSRAQACTSLQGVLAGLDESEYSLEQKWKIQWVFCHYEEAFETAASLVQKAQDIIAESEGLWRPLVQNFIARWEERLAHVSFQEYMFQTMQFSIEENPLGTVMLPQVIGTNQLYLSEEAVKEGERKKKADVCRIGIVAEALGTGFFKASPSAQKKHIALMLKLLADESKLEILSLLKERAYYGGELAKKLNLTTATISHHMGILAGNGLVTVNKQQNRLYYGINEAAVQNLLESTRELLLKD